MSTEQEVIKPKPNTIEAVAKLAGVSTMTVSRVLRDTGNVSAKTQERVREAISTLGYVHNRLAGALASSRSTQIAILVPSIQNIVFADVLAGVAERIDGTGFQPVIGVTEYDGARELELVRSMMAWRCAGIVLGHPSHLPETIHLLKSADFPVVELMALQEQPIDMCVGLDQSAAGRDMALHLLEKGYRRYAYLGTPHELDTSAALRYWRLPALVAWSWPVLCPYPLQRRFPRATQSGNWALIRSFAVSQARRSRLSMMWAFN